MPTPNRAITPDRLKPLAGLQLLARVSGAGGEIADALRRRMAVLGAESQSDSHELNEAAVGAIFEAELRTRQALTSRVVIQPWADEHSGGNSASLEAAAGITVWHGRAAGLLRPLGVPYLPALTASLATTGGIAALLAQHRGRSASRVSINAGAAALMVMAQYLAMDGAGQTLFNPVQRDDRAPPFTSRDGVVFELEALSAETWLGFWQRVSAAHADVASGWPPFQARYTQAQAFLPIGLFCAASLHDFIDLQKWSAQAGTDICAVRTAGELLDDARFRGWSQRGSWDFDAITSDRSTLALPPFGSNDLPLSGLTIIESCRLIQGPLAGHLLRLLGARVIKIEPPGGDPMRGMEPLFGGISAHFQTLNRDKEIVECDFRSRAGRNQLFELAREADVFLHNWGPGRALKLGLTAADFARHAPQLVYASASGSGSSLRPGDPMGTDFMMQARCGLASAIRRANGEPAGSLLTLVDVLGGAATAEGIVAALYARTQCPDMIQLDSSLAGAAALLMAQSFTTPPANPSACPINRQLELPAVFATLDGHLMLDEVVADATAAELAALSSGSRQRLETLLVERDTAENCATLRAKSIAAMPLSRSVNDVAEHPAFSGSLRCDATGWIVKSPWTFTA